MSPTVIAAIITGSLGAAATITAALIKKGRRKKAEETDNPPTTADGGGSNSRPTGNIHIKNVKTIKAKRDLTISTGK